jgi:subtilisin family serine protease
MPRLDLSRAPKVALTFLSLLLLAAPALPQKAVDVILTGAQTPDVIQTVARVGKNDELSITKPTDLRALVAERCGSVNPVYLTLVADLNPDLKKQPGDMVEPGATLVLPACLRTQILETHVLRAGETISQLYSDRGFPLDAQGLESGSAANVEGRTLAIALDLKEKGRLDTNEGYRGFIATQNAFAFMLANKVRNASSLKPGDSVVIPVAPISSTIAASANLTSDVAVSAINLALKTDGPKKGGTASRASIAKLIASVSLPLGDCNREKAEWPIDHATLNQAFIENAAARPKNSENRIAKVLILDTGIEDIETWSKALPPQNLGKMLGYNMRSGMPQYYGVNLATEENEADPPLDLEDRLHGAEVAATVLGGSIIPPSEKLRLSIKLSFAGISTADADGVPFLSAAAVARAFQQAKANQIPIVNASLDATEDRDIFALALKQAGEDVLFVVAAGNDGQAFSPSNSTWPASFGGAPANGLGGLVVTVGAHDMAGVISPFTRRGPGEVDILAPGCVIKTYSKEGRSSAQLVEQSREGTSYSAPIISLVAAILYSEGLAPADIKRRLLYSADMDGAWQTLVHSSGKLNLRAALSLWRDYVDYGEGQDRKIRTGALVDRSMTATACARSFAMRNLVKLARVSDSTVPTDPPRLHVWLVPSAANSLEFSRSDCSTSKISATTVKFKDGNSGEVVDIPLSAINNFVARSVDPGK